MRVAVVNETSAVQKHPFIISALDGRGLDVVNAGMAEPGEDPELQYIHTGLISALLLAADRVDMVIGGCGTGQGYMNAVVQYPGVVCGHLLTPLDALLWARINAGNVISLALNQGWGWASEENLSLLFDQLFTDERGRGYPIAREEPQRILAWQTGGHLRGGAPVHGRDRSSVFPTTSCCRPSRIRRRLRRWTSPPSPTASYERHWGLVCSAASRVGRCGLPQPRSQSAGIPHRANCRAGFGRLRGG